MEKPFDEDDFTAAKPPTKLKPTKSTSSVKTKSKSKLKEPNLSVDELQPIAESTLDTKVITKKTSRSRLAAKAATVEVDEASAASQFVTDDEAKPPVKSAIVKKKSTLGRLTDLIAKSPILEPLRGLYSFF